MAPTFIPPDPTIPRGFLTGYRDPFVTTAEILGKYAKLSHRLSRAVEAVSRRITVNPSSRVVRWIKAVDRLSSTDKRDVLVQLLESAGDRKTSHPFRDAFIAITESRTFVAVVEQLIDYLSDSDLRELVKGHPDPARDAASARARNKEFEWYIAALFRLGGLPVAIEEPDVLIDLDGTVRSIAAKRVFSRKQLRSNVNNATDQIDKAGYPGYVFLEVTRYINPDMHYVEHWRYEGRTIGPRMDALAANPDVVTDRSPHVRSVFLRSAFPLISPGFEYGTMERWNAIGMSADSRDENVNLLHTLVSAARSA